MDVFTEIVLFDLPENEPDALLRVRASPALWRPAPDLLHAQFLHDEPARAAGVAYIWRDRSAAADSHDAAWHAEIAAIFGPPRIAGVCTPAHRDGDALWPIGALAA